MAGNLRVVLTCSCPSPTSLPQYSVPARSPAVIIEFCAVFNKASDAIVSHSHAWKWNVILDKECTSSEEVQQIDGKDDSGKSKAVKQLYLIVFDSKIQSFHFKVFSTVVLYLEQVWSKFISQYSLHYQYSVEHKG